MPATHRAGVILAAVFVGLTSLPLGSLRANDRGTSQSSSASDADRQKPLCGPLAAADKSTQAGVSRQAGDQARCQAERPASRGSVVSSQAVEAGASDPKDYIDLASMDNTISLDFEQPVRVVAIEVAADVDDFRQYGGQDAPDLVNEELDWSRVPTETDDQGYDETDDQGYGQADSMQWGEIPLLDGCDMPCPSYHGGCQCQDCCGITYPYLGLLGYLLMPSDPCLADFISPMSNPVFFEDPRSLSEVRGIFLNNTVPSEAGGGQVRLFALQARAALSDRLSVIATKSGFISSSHPAIGDGWADLAAGVKYNIVSDACTGHLFSLGATYEFSVGSPQTLQDTGDGRVNAFVTGGTRIGSRLHWLSAAGYHIPMDTSIDSQSWYWSNHLDLRISECIYLLAECNWYHWTKSGSGGIDGLEGLDLFNFGSTGVTGKDIATGAVGIKLKPHRHVEVGVAWEAPMTDERDIMDNRLTVDFILRY